MDGIRPTERSWLRRFRVYITLGAISGSALLLVVVALSPFVQPSIALIDVTARAYGCPSSGPYHWTLNYVFVLVNSGGGNGLATVTLSDGNGQIASSQYLVGAHSFAVQNETFRTVDSDGWPCPSPGHLAVALQSISRV